MAGSDDETDTPAFKNSLVKEIFKLSQQPTTRVNDAALHLSAEYLRLFATEALHRAAEVAAKEKEERGAAEFGPALLEVRHLEKVVAGLLLDF